ncbi:30S ribosomal protein S1 [Gimesia panareensis]|uniref:30S ribosomal protein S1 n=1 Tax=Gimesia panareensis TaxID=2527978 RepID=A0A517Q2D1_9PLAN|nr:Tex family protein [Gimesia panareensis]QDT25794.1 30S ribosomal protein S1 [Gimesia panareensis]
MDAVEIPENQSGSQFSERDAAQIAEELNLTSQQIQNVIALLDEGNTVPFITRYRKERTGNLDEVQIRDIQKRVQSKRQLRERASTILRLIEAQQQLTPELKAEIEKADTLKRLEDLYRPYRPKRTSRAATARKHGFEPLANAIWAGDDSITDLNVAAEQYIKDEEGAQTTEDVLKGAADILVEKIGEDPDVRDISRRIAWRSGKLTVNATKKAEESGQEYRDYFNYSERAVKVPHHRTMALNRGEKSGALRVRFEWEEESARQSIATHLKLDGHRFSEFLTEVVTDALQRLILPSLEREIRRELTEKAEKHAVSVFAQNLKNLLLQPPLQGERILAIDPGLRTGCKLAVLDELGYCLATDLVYVTGSAEKKDYARNKLADIMTEHNCKLVAIGNGTACRETEEIITEMIEQNLPEARYLIVNEAGASIYSASPVAREEFPDLDATIRGTISIGRRLQDPLSELVKIDPQHLGVGMYQHDVNSKRLKESLDEVIESCVNYVGVNLNTASASLLRHVSGMNQLIARRITEWRDQHGSFQNRKQLLDVAGIGEATFTQAAGFLKIDRGDEPLDSTWIHPESYEHAHKVLEQLELPPDSLKTSAQERASILEKVSQIDKKSLSGSLQIGLPTLEDILEAIARPRRDPRSDLPGPIFKQGVLKLEQLTEGMELQGTVLNVVDFGAFVDVGLKDSALIHVSEMANHFIESPYQFVSVGDVITAWVLGVDLERRRVSLTLIKPGTVRPPKKSQRAPAKPKEQKKPAAPEKKQGESSTPRSHKPGKKKRNKSGKKQAPLPKLTDEMKTGDQPLQGFDQLKALWNQKKK